MLRTFNDQLGNTIEISFPPQRIVSLVPSQTELLFDLGLEDRIVGITRFCNYPKEQGKTKVKVGGTKKIDLHKISELNPDLIIANKEENTKGEIEELQRKYPVWVSDIHDLKGALEMIQMLGDITGKLPEASEIIYKIKTSFDNFRPDHNLSVAYLIWKNPFMTIGSDTFIHYMLTCAGYRNVFENTLRYPVVGIIELRHANPDLIFLSSEPYPFFEKNKKEFQEICPDAKIVLVDGEYFSWYGTRLLGAVEYFKALPTSLRG